MEMSHVRYFLALREEANFTRAARRCGVAQPSLTRAIQVLEAELGGPLFVRELAGVRLTALGARIEPHLRAIAQQVAAVEGLMTNPLELERFDSGTAERQKNPPAGSKARPPGALNLQPGL